MKPTQTVMEKSTGGEHMTDKQVLLTDNPEKIKQELREQKEEQIQQEKEIQRDKEEFERYFKCGSTIVIFRDGKYYFWGDITHCGEESIFHNAREIRRRMIETGARYGYMNYNDLPTFDKGADWEKENQERIELYEDDLYVFEGDEIKLVEKAKCGIETQDKGGIRMYFIMENRLPVTDEASGELITFDSVDDARKYCDKNTNFWEICKIVESWN